MLNSFKKIVVFMATIVLSLSFNVEAYSSDNVIDTLNYLTQEEVNSLQSTIEEIQDSKNLDLVVVITDNVEGKTSRDYADDYYDYNGYGLDSSYSGALLLVNMYDRETWISTTGRAIDILTDARIDNILDDVTDCLIREDYYGASNYFLKLVDKYASNHAVIPFSENLADSFTSIFTYIVSAIFTTVVLTLIVNHDIHGSPNITQDTYLAKNSFKLNSKEDTYITSHISKTKIQKSGTSSTHGSSSGRTHGGGGRKF